MKTKYLNAKKQPIKISHFPGWSRYTYKSMMEEMSKTKTSLPDNVTVMTVVDDDTANYDRSILINQLKSNNIPFINAAEHKDVYPWVNNKKIKLIVDALSKVQTEYCLILDGIDVTINDDLKDIISIFNTYGKDIIFNATAWAHPAVDVDIIEDREKKYGTYCYLNAGCCIGKTEALKTFYAEVLELFNNCPKDDPNYSSEQYFVRQAFKNHMDTVFFDYECKLFQVWHKATPQFCKYDRHTLFVKIKQI